MSVVTRVLERLSLMRQVVLASLLAAAIAALLSATSLHAWPAWAASLLGSVLAAAAAGWVMHRHTAGISAIAQGAQAVTAGEAEADEAQAQIPFRTESLDLQDCTLALRRAVDSLRERISALNARNAALGVQLQTRTKELTSLQDLSFNLARHGDIGALAGEALKALEQTMDYASASIWAREDLDPARPVLLLGYRSGQADEPTAPELTGGRLSRSNVQRYEQIEQAGEPIVENHPHQSLLSWLWEVVSDDARTSALYRSTRSWMAVPLTVRERVLGVLRVDHGEPGRFDDERVRLLRSVANQTALAMRHAHLLARERDQVAMAERNRLARDLHDAVSQTLFAANLVAGALAKDPNLVGASAVQVQTLQRLNQGALAEMRMLMFELRPDALAVARLPELLQHACAALAARGEVEIRTEIDATEPPTPQRMHVYRVAQEALSNVARHAAARHVLVQWKAIDAHHGRLTIQDDGHGFDVDEEHPGHFGLDNMRERAQLLGGALHLRSTPGQGTRVELDMAWA